MPPRVIPKWIKPAGRYHAAALHLLASASIALILALVVFVLWYPSPFRDLAGGLHLFGLVVAVDVVTGPLLTLAVFNAAKPRKELMFDLTVIGFLQLGALAYGVHTVAAARPVVLAYEVDRFVAVPAAQVQTSELPDAPGDLKTLSWVGPRIVGTRTPRDAAEQVQSIQLSFQGIEPSVRPSWWVPYPEVIDSVRRRMKPVDGLGATLSLEQKTRLSQAVARSRVDSGKLFYLPLTGHASDAWIVLLDGSGNIVSYAPVNGFGSHGAAGPR